MIENDRFRITPARALRRPKVKAVLKFLAFKEVTAREVWTEVKVSKWYCYVILRGLRNAGMVDRFHEPGVYPSFKASEKAILLMKEKGALNGTV
jgi:hypothetical protein